MRHYSLIAGLCLLLAAPAIAEVQLEIGPDTTVIDGPVNPDGTLNYLAYLNQKLSEGVTPENNFAVDVALSMPPDAWPNREYQQQVYAWLKIDAPDESLIFERFTPHMEVRDNAQPQIPWQEQVQHAAKSPWSAERYPEVKKWLDAHDGAIESIARGSMKDHFAVPMFVVEGQEQAVFLAMLPHLGQVRGLGRAFAVRAQFKITAGDIEGAWSDVLTLHRLAELTTMESEFLCGLVSISVENMALDVTRSLLTSEGVNVIQYRQMIKDSLSLPRAPGPASAIDLSSRLGTVDTLLRGRAGQLQGDILSEDTCQFLTHEQFDVNFALRQINRRFDQFAQAAEIKDPLERLRALERIEKEISDLVEQTRLMLKGDTKAVDAMRETIEQSNIYTVGGLYLLIGDTFPRASAYVGAQVKMQMRLDLQPVALAIAAYRLEHDQFPPDLHALVPAYLDSLPTDFATGELPVYRVKDGAAIVYSLGTDLEDGGGVDDPIEGDIVFRIER